MKLRRGPLSAATLLLFLAMACGSFSAPKSCGEGLSGTADQAAFGRYFTDMHLTDQDTGLEGLTSPDEEFSLPRGNPLGLAYSGLTSGSLHVCIQERSGGGEIPVDQTFRFEQADAIIQLGSFEPGSYVLRAIVDETLVRNLTFLVK